MQTTTNNPPFLDIGFRPFFLGAGLFAMLSMLLWSGVYIFQVPLPTQSISMFEWHAHEMFYGYAFAVIAGFLLTSVKTWTKRPTAHGSKLLFLFLLWLSARILFFFGDQYIQFVAIFDLSFALMLSYILAQRIIQAKQWKQLAIIGKILLITTCNIFFYLGAMGFVEHGIIWGIYGSLYLVIALILTMGRRVIPFFIERATNDTAQLVNSKWIDISSLVFFIIFAINELFVGHPIVTAYIAMSLFIVNATRLIGWYQPIIWKQGLLWSIYLSFWMITLGFLLFALPHFTAIEIPKFIAIHAFTVGGIGMITLGMMSRVSLAHTGRNVYDPPKAISYAFGAILLSAVIRVFLPLFEIVPYEILIGTSQVLWIIAFAIFTVTYAPILLKTKQ
ncbi:MAG: NnrS family protein [Ghiorsea sp.]